MCLIDATSLTASLRRCEHGPPRQTRTWLCNLSIFHSCFRKGILILKSAAVIGEVFGSKVLQHICPLRHDTHKQILQVLKCLEQHDYIEILDETDPKNAVCRFRKSFFRETVYQIMLYRAQKKGLH